MPVPSLMSEPVVEPPKAVAKATLLAPVSMDALVALVIVRRAEMSCVLPEAHCRVPPATLMLPVVPREPLEKVRVPALMVVPPE